MFQDADDAFFQKKLYNKTHVLYKYLPEPTDRQEQSILSTVESIWLTDTS